MRPYYESDGVAIYHGDCRQLLPDLAVSPDLTVADVPYNQTSLSWDRWPASWLNLNLGRSLWCFGSLRIFHERADEFAAAGWILSHDIIWEKHNGSSFHTDRFRRVHEQVAHFYRGAWGEVYKSVPKTNDATRRQVRRKTLAHMGRIGSTVYVSEDGGPRQMRSVIHERSMHGRAENETQKPLGVVVPLIQYGCPRGGLVLSPFAGSGTDLVAARMCGCRAIGIEVREEQCEVAARRLASALPLEVA